MYLYRLTSFSHHPEHILSSQHFQDLGTCYFLKCPFPQKAEELLLHFLKVKCLISFKGFMEHSCRNIISRLHFIGCIFYKIYNAKTKQTKKTDKTLVFPGLSLQASISLLILLQTTLCQPSELKSPPCCHGPGRHSSWTVLHQRLPHWYPAAALLWWVPVPLPPLFLSGPPSSQSMSRMGEIIENRWMSRRCTKRNEGEEMKRWETV